MIEIVLLDNREIPLKNSASLLDSINWIAGRIYPVHQDYYSFTKKDRECLTKEKKDHAINELLYKLMRGEIIAKGYPCHILEEPEFGPRIDHVRNAMEIPSSLWKADYISWEKSELKTEFGSDGFCRISVKYTALLEFYSDTHKATPKYSAQKASIKCESWLKAEIDSGIKSKNRDEYRDEAMSKFPGLTGRGFRLIWANATKNTYWQQSGRRRKQKS